VVVPVALGVPAVLALVPPLVTFPPATLARFVQFMTLVIRLPAVASMSFDCLMEFVFRVRNPALAVVVGFCMKSWGRAKKQNHGQYRSRK
jgi:hypothetical protein